MSLMLKHKPFGNLTIGAFLRELDFVPDDYKVVFENGNNPSKFVDSYRGYYDDAELTGFVNSKKEEVTVKELRERITSQLGTFMIGYKGGEFAFTLQTWLWAGEYGSTLEYAVVGLEWRDNEAVILTRKIEKEY